MPQTPTIDEIISRAKAYHPALDEARIRRAYDFAEEAHRGQTRFSGEPYIVHPLHVTSFLLDFHPDEDSIITALLHDVAEDTPRTLDDIERAFGPQIRELCSGLMKLSKVKSKLNDPQMENLRKLFLAMAKDFRVILIKLCDRLHNMSTLEHVRPEKRTRIAQETLNVYAPIAARLGIYRLKSQIEDLCFEQLHPDEFKEIRGELTKTEKWRARYIQLAKGLLDETLAKEGIQARTVDGRVKSFYSIYRKLQKKHKHSLSDIFDVFAMRIILPDISKHGKEYVGHLYTALGVLHNHFTPLAQRFKDYVAVPKVNGYRSLHTTVMGLGPKEYTQPTEIQLRTEGMHRAAELGIAAHWMYEEEKAPASVVAKTPYIEQQRQWITGLSRIEHEIQSNQELLENLKQDTFRDRIFVLTPRGDVKDLPEGATPIDFAYVVHTEIGNHCVGARVNGVMVPLDHELKNGEVVDILTRKNAMPSQRWLTFVKTSHALGRIRSWFRNQNSEGHLKSGRLLLNEKLEQLGHPPLDVHLSLLKHYGAKNLTLHERQDLLIELGKGVVLPSTVVRKIFTLEELLGMKPGKKAASSSIRKEIVKEPKLSIGNEAAATTLPHHFVQCCKASYADDLVGYITRGRGVSVHRRACTVLRATEKNRLVTVHVLRHTERYPIQVKVEAEDRIGLVRDLTHILAENQANIVDLSQSYTKTGLLNMNFVIEVGALDQLERVLSKFEKIPSVRWARKVN